MIFSNLIKILSSFSDNDLRNFKKNSILGTLILFHTIFQLNLGIFITDKKSEFSVLVDRATGGASIKDGQVEIMLHRFNFLVILYFCIEIISTYCGTYVHVKLTFHCL